MGKMERIILDVDSAGDDILAVLFVAISPSIRIEGVTTVTGAAGPIDQVTNVVLNTLALTSLTIWFIEGALAGWRAQTRTTPGGQRHYSDLAIETALTLRAVFRLALRQCEGMIGSIMRMLDIDLPVPDHTTLSRQACRLPVQSHRRIETGNLHLIVDSTG
jgi:Transposase DDE domain